MTDTNTQQQPMPQPPPSAVPFFDENYTFQDRERELALMENLLRAQLSSTQMELGLVRRSIVTKEYLAHVDQADAPKLRDPSDEAA